MTEVAGGVSTVDSNAKTVLSSGATDDAFTTVRGEVGDTGTRTHSGMSASTQITGFNSCTDRFVSEIGGLLTLTATTASGEDDDEFDDDDDDDDEDFCGRAVSDAISPATEHLAAALVLCELSASWSLLPTEVGDDDADDAVLTASTAAVPPSKAGKVEVTLSALSSDGRPALTDETVVTIAVIGCESPRGGDTWCR